MAIKDDIILDLNFVPDWAKKPPEGPKLSGYGEKTRSKLDQKPRQRQRPSAAPRNRNYAERDRRHTPARPEQDNRYERRYTPQHDTPPRLNISFMPERRGLKPVASKLARTRRAFPLMDVAHMFISKPQFFAIKFECAENDNQEKQTLFQCKECKSLFLQKQTAEKHVFEKHFNLFYETEETVGEPPKGNFTCVARCGLSKELLGPPNYHGYNAKVLELHAARFSHMPIEDYRNKIVNETDPALIEQWKEAARKQITFKTTKEKDQLVFPGKHDAESHFMNNYAAGAIAPGKRFIVPGTVGEQLEDTDIKREYREALNAEQRFSLKMSIALRPAFRHLGLHTFKAGEKAIFVTSISPNPIAPSATADVIKEALDFIIAHPGICRKELVEKLKPDCEPDSGDAAALINHLRWLIDKGHVIEFFDGKLSVPELHRKVST